MSIQRKVLFVTGSALVIIGVVAISITHKTPLLPTPVQPLTIANLNTDVNQERIKAHEAPLTLDPALNQSAAAKCADMVSKHYWDHVAPDGTNWESFIKEPHRIAGENLSARYAGTNVSQQVVDGWMGSPEHRANILDAHFTNVGYAICQVPNYPNAVVQHFSGKE